jgi:hypothetical protein
VPHAGFGLGFDLARLLGTPNEVERRALEALALEEYKLGHLNKTELRRLGFETGQALDRFLHAHEAYRLDKAARKVAEPADTAPGEVRRAKARQAASNIIARARASPSAGSRSRISSMKGVSMKGVGEPSRRLVDDAVVVFRG